MAMIQAVLPWSSPRAIDKTASGSMSSTSSAEHTITTVTRVRICLDSGGCPTALLQGRHREAPTLLKRT